MQKTIKKHCLDEGKKVYYHRKKDNPVTGLLAIQGALNV